MSGCPPSEFVSGSVAVRINRMKEEASAESLGGVWETDERPSFRLTLLKDQQPANDGLLAAEKY